MADHANNDSKRPTVRAGCVVKHRPSGETWLLAWARPERDEVCAMGWPESIAKLSDCDLVDGCTDAESLDVLLQAAVGPGPRAAEARRQLIAMQGGGRAVSRVDVVRAIVDVLRLGLDIYENHRNRKEREADREKNDRIARLERELEIWRQEHP